MGGAIIRSAWVGFFLGGALACGIEPSTSGSEDDLIHGKAAGEALTAVGAFIVEGQPECTATLIAPRWVVTARHCLNVGTEDGDVVALSPAAATFVLGADARKPDRRFALRRFIPAPAISDESQASDVALGELEADVQGVRPIPISTAPLTDKELGTKLEVVGFGVFAADGNGDASGRREVGMMNLAAVSGNALQKRFGTQEKFFEFLGKIDPQGLKADVGSRLWGSGELAQGYEVLARDPDQKVETCYGDSGGPLIRTRNGVREVVGVVSRGFPGVRSLCLPLGTVFATFGPKAAELVQRHLGRPEAGCGRLLPGQALHRGQELRSCNGKVVLVLEDDGNLVLYANTVAVWSTKTPGTAGDTAIVQEDGNFVLYGAGTPLWSTGTSRGPLWLNVQDDANLVLYSNANEPRWAR